MQWSKTGNRGTEEEILIGDVKIMLWENMGNIVGGMISVDRYCTQFLIP